MATNKMEDSYKFWDDLRWAKEHSTELHRKFRNVWAISGKKVIAFGPNLKEVETDASERTGISPEEIAVEFIESGDAIYGQSIL